jgi:hypothetical protein
MLLCTLGMFFAFGMITLAMLLCRGAMRLRGVIVVFGCLIVFITCHLMLPFVRSPAATKPVAGYWFHRRWEMRAKIFATRWREKRHVHPLFR